MYTTISGLSPQHLLGFCKNEDSAWIDAGLPTSAAVHLVLLTPEDDQKQVSNSVVHDRLFILANPPLEEAAKLNILSVTVKGSLDNHSPQTLDSYRQRMESRFKNINRK